jgi:hypothetical protein
MTLSQLFKAAIKHLPKEEFLCHAIDEVIRLECEKHNPENYSGRIARRELYTLGYKAKDIVMTLLEGFVSLDSWIANQKGVRSIYYGCSSGYRVKMMLKTRKAWARHLAKQYKGVK